MRDIKFRGKTEVSGKWSYGNLCIRIDGAMIITPDETPLGTYGKVDRNTVGQYTGLHDKNGTEIYEGDIVHIPDNWEEYGWTSGKNYAIDFKEGRFRLKPKYKPNAIGYDLEHTDELEVIGNIYDNPELLGG